MKIYTKKTPLDTDTLTPIGVFLNIRNHYTKIALLESNDYSKKSESKSFIAFSPISEIKIENDELQIYENNKLIKKHKDSSKDSIMNLFMEYFSTFEEVGKKEEFCGMFGSFGFEFSHFIEKQIKRDKEGIDFPDLHLILFEYVIVIDHFNNEYFLIQTSFNEEIKENPFVLQILQQKSNTSFYFEKIGEESSSISDSEFTDLVKIAKSECKKGNVFQLVFSRDFSQNYFGDDFEVYRALRKLNPSPYLFYFDFASHRILGSSPEAQLKIENSIAEIHPIAGTVKKTGDEFQDNLAINFLIHNEKENAEHTMLVDLARNDLSKNCSQVKVKNYKEIQHFSHVIHLVSKIIGKINNDTTSIDLFNNTFPAGTLSGTPKPKALELIHQYEKTKRGFYGGALGFISFSGNLNLAIIIRSILSKNNKLHYRAGAGIVLNSDEKSELQEVNNKIEVLRKSIEIASLTKEKILK
jgi:anthranilate synthase component I